MILATCFIHFFFTFMAPFSILSLVFIIRMLNLYVVNNFLHFFQMKVDNWLEGNIDVKFSLFMCVIHCTSLWFQTFLFDLNQYMFTKKLWKRINEFMRNYLFMIIVTVQLEKKSKKRRFSSNFDFFQFLTVITVKIHIFFQKLCGYLALPFYKTVYCKKKVDTSFLVITDHFWTCNMRFWVLLVVSRGK